MGANPYNHAPTRHHRQNVPVSTYFWPCRVSCVCNVSSTMQLKESKNFSFQRSFHWNRFLRRKYINLSTERIISRGGILFSENMTVTRAATLHYSNFLIRLSLVFLINCLVHKMPKFSESRVTTSFVWRDQNPKDFQLKIIKRTKRRLNQCILWLNKKQLSDYQTVANYSIRPLTEN